MDRRHFLASMAVTILGTSRASAQHAGHGAMAPLPEAASSHEPFARLQGGAPHHLTPEQEPQRVVDSPAPAGPPGRWVSRAALPIPRSEMAWATALNSRMHIVGGYGEGRVDRAYHHVYDPASDRWFNAAPLPRGANHVAVAADAGLAAACAAAPAARSGCGRRARGENPSDRRGIRADHGARQRRLARGVRSAI